jgi:glycine/D-amino acid oxidase-like deaminating enzyme
MKRTQVYLTEEQDRRLAQLAEERGISRAGALRWALDSALETGDAEVEARAVILATAGILSDYPDWPEWQRSVRGRTAAERLDSADDRP